MQTNRQGPQTEIKGEEIAELKEKKRALESCIQCLERDIVDYSLVAEKESDLSLLTKANSFRVTVFSKKETLTNLESALYLVLELNSLCFLICFIFLWMEYLVSKLLKTRLGLLLKKC